MIRPLAALLRLHEINQMSKGKPISDTQQREVSRLLQSITPEAHRAYLQNLKKYGDNAVAPISHGACTGCYVKQPSVMSEIEDSIYRCQSCGRLIYDQDEAYELSVG